MSDYVSNISVVDLPIARDAAQLHTLNKNVTPPIDGATVLLFIDLVPCATAALFTNIGSDQGEFHHSDKCGVPFVASFTFDLLCGSTK